MRGEETENADAAAIVTAEILIHARKWLLAQFKS
jgi:hypothetical protein